MTTTPHRGMRLLVFNRMSRLTSTFRMSMTLCVSFCAGLDDDHAGSLEDE
jgi:hypothetical protein